MIEVNFAERVKVLWKYYWNGAQIRVLQKCVIVNIMDIIKAGIVFKNVKCFYLVEPSKKNCNSFDQIYEVLCMISLN